MSRESAERARAAILHDLASPDEEVRRLAVERLPELPTDEARAGLLTALGDESWRVRKSAVERIVAEGDSEDLQTSLIHALADGENPGRRNSAYEALVGIGTSVTDRLVESLTSDDVDVRKLVLDTLAGIGDPDACAPVCRALSDPDPNVRGAAADALGVIGSAEAGSALHAAAVQADEDQLVRLSALRALALIEFAISVDELAPVLEVGVLRPAAYALLGRVGDRAAVACLLKGLDLNSRPSREAAMASLLGVLAKSDGQASLALVLDIREAALAADQLIPSAVERLEQADLSTRMMLIQFLGLCRDPRSVIPILEAGRDEAIAEISHATLESLGDLTFTVMQEAWADLDLELRTDACRLMGRVEASDDATTLLLGALDDVDAELRAAAARALGQRQCVEAMPELVRRLETAALDAEPESEDEVRALVEALVTLASPHCKDGSVAIEVIQRLSARLQGAKEELRLAIATVLGRIGRHEDEELVADLLRDPSARVRRAAVEALSRLEPGAASEPLRLALADESPLVRVAAAVALGNSSNAAVIDDLQRLIHDEDPRVSSAAVRSIGAHCQRDNVPVEQAVSLVEHALSGNGMVALAVVDALDLIGGQYAAEAALKVLDREEPEPVQAAVACIGANGDPETVAELVSLIAHSSWSVRAEAIQTLSDRGVKKAVPSILRRLETEQDSFVRDAINRALKRLED
jgi:HEAT repeat protein